MRQQSEEGPPPLTSEERAIVPPENKLFTPFAFLNYGHSELASYWWGALGVGALWVVADIAVAALAGPQVVFGQGGVMSQLPALLSVLAGVFLGLVGVVLSSPSEKLNVLMVNSPTRPGRNGITRRELLVDLLAYGAAVSVLLTLAIVLLGGILGSLDDVSWPVWSSWSSALRWTFRCVATLTTVTLTVHLGMLVLIALRFMQRAA